MSTFAVILLCIQACLVQNVFGQCGSIAGLIPPAPIAAIAPSGCGIGLGPAAYAPTPISYAPPVAYSPAAGVIGTAAGYGAIGEGNVAVSGELPVAGNTAVAGQVPIIGIVSFGGAVPAAGAVSIAGQCACGCSSIY